MSVHDPPPVEPFRTDFVDGDQGAGCLGISGKGFVVVSDETRNHGSAGSGRRDPDLGGTCSSTSLCRAAT